MVRRALSLRRGSTLSLEVETTSPSTRSFSLPGSEIIIAQNETNMNPVGDTDSLTTCSDSIQTRQPHRSNSGRLPLSRHHQNIRKKSSMSSLSTTGSGHTTSTTALPPRSRNHATRTRTNSASTSVSLTSTNSSNSLGSLDELGSSPIVNRSGGLSSMLDDELAVIVDDDFEDNGSDSSSDPCRLGGLRPGRTKAGSTCGESLMVIGEDVGGI